MKALDKSVEVVVYAKLNCAQKFFAGITTDQVKYDVVSDYAKLMDIVK